VVPKIVFFVLYFCSVFLHSHDVVYLFVGATVLDVNITTFLYKAEFVYVVVGLCKLFSSQ